MTDMYQAQEVTDNMLTLVLYLAVLFRVQVQPVHKLLLVQ